MSAQDYYPFGMIMPGRTVINGTRYRYGFGGQERTPESVENGYTAEFWQYDSRIGRRWNVDPVCIGTTTSYHGLMNNPILFVDPLGLDTVRSSSAAKNIGDVVQHRNGRSNFFWNKTAEGFEGGGSSEILDEVTVIYKRSAVKNYLNWPNSTRIERRHWDIDQLNYRIGNFSKLTQSQIAMYQRWSKAEQDYRAMSIGAMAILSAPVGIAGAPSLFSVGTELWGMKAVLSISAQAAFNGVEDVDYADVVGDAFTAPGLNGLIGGGIDYRPFARTKRFQVAGYNKSLSSFAVDFSIGAGTGVAGDIKWSGLKPLLRTSTERSVFYLSTQSWVISANQGFNQKANNALDKK